MTKVFILTLCSLFVLSAVGTCNGKWISIVVRTGSVRLKSPLTRRVEGVQPSTPNTPVQNMEHYVGEGPEPMSRHHLYIVSYLIDVSSSQIFILQPTRLEDFLNLSFCVSLMLLIIILFSCSLLLPCLLWGPVFSFNFLLLFYTPSDYSSITVSLCP